MNSLFRRFTLALLGVVFAVLGVYYAITVYPAPSAFTTFSRDWPTIGTVASFYCAIAVAVLGVLLLLPFLLRSGRSGSRSVRAGGYDPRRGYGDQHDGWDPEPDADPYATDYEEDDYDRNRPRGGHGG